MSSMSLSTLSRLAALAASASSNITSASDELRTHNRLHTVTTTRHANNQFIQYNANNRYSNININNSNNLLIQLQKQNPVQHAIEEQSQCLHEFDMQKVLGKGGFGIVVEAASKIDGKLYALKLVPCKDEWLNDDLEDEEHPLQEAHLLSRIGMHTNIAHVVSWWAEPYAIEIKELLLKQFNIVDFDVPGSSDYEEEDSFDRVDSYEPSKKENYTADSLVCLQLELCNGPNLKSYLKGLKNPLSNHEVIVLFWDILVAVQHVHSKGIVHRDLKPENIMFHDRNLKVVDFGLAAVVSSPSRDNLKDLSRPGIGTPTYASPEQLTGGSVGYSSDIFSLGVILFEMMSSFSTDMERIMCLSNFRKGKVQLDLNRCEFLTNLALWMTKGEASARPSVIEIFQTMYTVAVNILGLAAATATENEAVEEAVVC